MLFWSIQVTLISIILIFLVHNLINFFKTNLTVPKIKDLVNTSTHQYENIYNIINSNKDTTHNLKPIEDKLTMKDELKNFLKTQLKKEADELDNIIEPSKLSYSNYL